MRAAERNMLHASYCLFGDEGIGKKTTAQEVASYLETGSFDSHNLIDMHIFSPNEKGTIGIDEVREIKEFCSKAPLKSKRRTAIIDSAESMTDQAQSALLKLFEDPMEHTLIFVIARNKDVLFTPLLSRMHTIYFSRFSRKQVVDFLVEQEHISGSIAERIAEQSFGSLGRALSIVHKKDQEEIKESVETYLEKSIESYYQKGSMKYADILKKLLKKEAEIKNFTLSGPLQKRAIQYFESRV